MPHRLFIVRWPKVIGKSISLCYSTPPFLPVHYELKHRCICFDFCAYVIVDFVNRVKAWREIYDRTVQSTCNKVAASIDVPLLGSTHHVFIEYVEQPLRHSNMTAGPDCEAFIGDPWRSIVSSKHSSEGPGPTTLSTILPHSL